MSMTATHIEIGPGQRDVDAAVRSVLAALFPAPASARAPEGLNGRAVAASGVEVFAGRLLSARLAGGLRPGIKVVRVAPGTVVTPLAKDVLKARGVEVRFVATAAVEEARRSGEWGFSIDADGGLVESFRRALLDDPGRWDDLGPALDDVTGWVAGGPGRGALVLTGESSLAVYRACQVAGVRAAAVADPSATARAVRSIGANLLVVEPASQSVAHLRQIGQCFRRSGAPASPDGLGVSDVGGRRQ